MFNRIKILVSNLKLLSKYKLTPGALLYYPLPGGDSWPGPNLLDPTIADRYLDHIYKAGSKRLSPGEWLERFGTPSERGKT